MIYGRIRDPRNSFIYHPAIMKALDALEQMDFTGDAKEVTIDGKRMFARIVDISTKPIADTHPEIHEHYVDLHYSLVGNERLCYSLKMPETVNKHDVLNDHKFFESFIDYASLDMNPGDFVIFFPEDFHTAGIAAEKPANIRKVIVKLSLDLFQKPLTF